MPPSLCGVWCAGRYFCVSRVASNRVVKSSLLIFNRKSHRRRRRRKLSRRVRERLESARPPFANYEFYKRPRRHRFLLFIFAPPPPFGFVTSDQKKKKKKNLILCPASSFVHIMSGRLMESQNDSTSFPFSFPAVSSHVVERCTPSDECVCKLACALMSF